MYLVKSFDGTSGVDTALINNAGQVVWNYFDTASSSIKGVLYANSTYTIIDDPLNQNGPGVIGGTVVVAINGSGQIVGTYNDESGVRQGFLFSAGSYTTIRPPQSQITVVMGIGQVAGYYIATVIIGPNITDTQAHAFIATPLDNIQAASLGVLRVGVSDLNASAIAISMNAGQTSFPQYINELIDQAQSTTVPALITYDFFYGTTPDTTGLDFVAHFAEQLSQIGFSLINVWVNFGASFAANGLFGPQYGSMTRDAFVDSVYSTVFGHAPAQLETHNFFTSAMDFYAAFAGSELGARGAITGIMLCLASRSATAR